MNASFVPLTVPAPKAERLVERKELLQEGHQTRLEVEKEGDQVKRIKIHCQCGETIVVDCVE